MGVTPIEVNMAWGDITLRVIVGLVNPDIDAAMLVVPEATPKAEPVEETEATSVAELIQVT